jgi:hypothetical protein
VLLTLSTTLLFAPCPQLTGGHSSYSPHKETAFERLTMPTAMRLLQKFGWTPVSEQLLQQRVTARVLKMSGLSP